MQTIKNVKVSILRNRSGCGHILNKHTSYEEPPNKKFWKALESNGSSLGLSVSKSATLELSVLRLH